MRTPAPRRRQSWVLQRQRIRTLVLEASVDCAGTAAAAAAIPTYTRTRAQTFTEGEDGAMVLRKSATSSFSSMILFLFPSKRSARRTFDIYLTLAAKRTLLIVVISEILDLSKVTEVDPESTAYCLLFMILVSRYSKRTLSMP